MSSAARTSVSQRQELPDGYRLELVRYPFLKGFPIFVLELVGSGFPVSWPATTELVTPTDVCIPLTHTNIWFGSATLIASANEIRITGLANWLEQQIKEMGQENSSRVLLQAVVDDLRKDL